MVDTTTPTPERVAYWKVRYEQALERHPPHLVVSQTEWEELRGDARPQTNPDLAGAATNWAGASVFVAQACPWGCCLTPSPVVCPKCGSTRWHSDVVVHARVLIDTAARTIEAAELGALYEHKEPHTHHRDDDGEWATCANCETPAVDWSSCESDDEEWRRQKEKGELFERSVYALVEALPLAASVFIVGGTSDD